MSESVIHDIGYRGYSGPREGTGQIAASLFLTGVRHVYGLGRSGRSKVLPFLLLALNLLPAVIVVGVVTLLDMGERLISYSEYTSQLQMVVSLFAAAQAPVLFSRDLRHRSIVLYLARPLDSAAFALTRWASLVAALLVFTLLPTLVLYAGGLLAGLDAGTETGDALKSLALQVLLACLLGSITGLISSWALRRGFAVVASIIVLVVGAGVVLVVQAIASEQSVDTAGEAAGLLSPWSLHNGLAEAWGASGRALVPLEGAWPFAYLAVALSVVLVCLALLVRRFAKVGAR